MMPAAAPPRIPTRVVRSKPSSRARNGGHKRAARYARVPPPVVYTPGRVQTAMRHMRSTSPLCMNNGGVNDRDMEPGPSFSTSMELSAVLNVSNSRLVESPTPSVVDELPSSRNALDAASTSFSEGQDMSPGTAKYLTFLNAKVRKSRKTYKTAEREAAAYVWVVPACTQQPVSRPLLCFARTLDSTIKYLPAQFLFSRQRIEGRMRRIVGDALRRIDNVWLVAAFKQWDDFTTELRYAEQRDDAIKIQRVARGYLARCEARRRRERRDEIQRRKDAREARKKRHLDMNATTIQRVVRGALSRMRFGNLHAMRTSALRIQRWYRHRTSLARTLMIILGKATRRRRANDIQRTWRGYKGRLRAKERQALVNARRRRANQRDKEYRTRYNLMARAAAPVIQRWWKHLYKWRHTKFLGHKYDALAPASSVGVSLTTAACWLCRLVVPIQALARGFLDRRRCRKRFKAKYEGSVLVLSYLVLTFVWFVQIRSRTIRTIPGLV